MRRTHHLFRIAATREQAPSRFGIRPIERAEDSDPFEQGFLKAEELGLIFVTTRLLSTISRVLLCLHPGSDFTFWFVLMSLLSLRRSSVVLFPSSKFVCLFDVLGLARLVYISLMPLFLAIVSVLNLASGPILAVDFIPFLLFSVSWRLLFYLTAI